MAAMRAHARAPSRIRRPGQRAAAKARLRPVARRRLVSLKDWTPGKVSFDFVVGF